MFKKIFLIIFLGGSLLFGYFLLAGDQVRPRRFLSPFISSSNSPSIIPTPMVPYEPYSFRNLAQRQFPGGSIRIGEKIKKEDDYDYTPYFFYFDSSGKEVSGQLNLPNRQGQFPVVIMIRGYVDKEIYFTGLGTRKAAGFFAENGFVTLAPDFLGFGQSDQETDDILLNRFRRPETVLSLLASIKNLNQALKDKGLKVSVDENKTCLWGHSNGGQIALSVLEITQSPFPTTLWAPVSKGFPESILQYASELDDNGRLVIKAVNDFKRFYDPNEFSITSFFDSIKAPLQIHQGTADSYISVEDSDQLVETLKKLGIKVDYFLYWQDDHNLKNNWDRVVTRDLGFFKKHLF